MKCPAEGGFITSAGVAVIGLTVSPFRRAIRTGSMGASSEGKPVLFEEIVRDAPGWPPS